MRRIDARAALTALVLCVGCARTTPEDAAWRSALEAVRSAKNAMFRTADGPLTPAQQATFAGLHYFAPDATWRLSGHLEAAASIDTVHFVTSKRSLEAYLRVGQVHFDRQGHSYALTLYRAVDSGRYFLPFTDATTGHSTYGAGRYLDLDVGPDGAVALDFNRAYSPYCAYNDGWVCPVAPAENHVSIAVQAGEQQFGAGH
jgi:uncharacterized protein (DUF1684 family)